VAAKSDCIGTPAATAPGNRGSANDEEDRQAKIAIEFNIREIGAWSKRSKHRHDRAERARRRI
jgi:hypothetical protein